MGCKDSARKKIRVCSFNFCVLPVENFLLHFSENPVSEFNEFEPPPKFTKNRFQLSAHRRLRVSLGLLGEQPRRQDIYNRLDSTVYYFVPSVGPVHEYFLVPGRFSIYLSSNHYIAILTLNLEKLKTIFIGTNHI